VQKVKEIIISWPETSGWVITCRPENGARPEQKHITFRKMKIIGWQVEDFDLRCQPVFMVPLQSDQMGLVEISEGVFFSHDWGNEFESYDSASAALLEWKQEEWDKSNGKAVV
jgi:hypothetical protein